MLVHLISAAVIAVGVVYHLKTVSKLKDSLQEKESVIKALQLHSEAVAKKRDQLVDELRVFTSVKKTTEFPIAESVPAKKKKTYKRKPKAKVEA
jgi:hypothetical protein